MASPHAEIAPHTLPTPGDLRGVDPEVLARTAEGARRTREEIAARRAGALVTTPAAQEVTARVTQEALPGLEQRLGWQERMTVIATDYGFLPTTKVELNQAMQVIGFVVSSKGKTAAHLNEVLRHNRAHGVTEPQAAVRSIVSGYGMYAADAKTKAANLTQLKEQLADVMNPTLTLETAGVDSSTPGLFELLQFKDLSKAAEAGNDTSLEGGIKKREGKKQLVTHYEPGFYSDETLRLMQVEQLLALPVSSVRGSLLDGAVASQTNRADFWQARLTESLNHGAAKPVAQKALAELT